MQIHCRLSFDCFSVHVRVEASAQGSLTAPGARLYHLVVIPDLGSQAHNTSAPSFTHGFWGMELRSSYVCDKHVSKRGLSPRPSLAFQMLSLLRKCPSVTIKIKRLKLPRG